MFIVILAPTFIGCLFLDIFDAIISFKSSELCYDNHFPLKFIHIFLVHQSTVSTPICTCKNALFIESVIKKDHILTVRNGTAHKCPNTKFESKDGLK